MLPRRWEGRRLSGEGPQAVRGRAAGCPGKGRRLSGEGPQAVRGGPQAVRGGPQARRCAASPRRAEPARPPERRAACGPEPGPVHNPRPGGEQ